MWELVGITFLVGTEMIVEFGPVQTNKPNILIFCVKTGVVSGKYLFSLRQERLSILSPGNSVLVDTYRKPSFQSLILPVLDPLLCFFLDLVFCFPLYYFNAYVLCACVYMHVSSRCPVCVPIVSIQWRTKVDIGHHQCFSFHLTH